MTGQAFEDMQEQNIRLMQQLREKDDANFKLMSERIKSNQIHKLLKEEKEELADQLLTLKTQVKHEATTRSSTVSHFSEYLKEVLPRFLLKCFVVVHVDVWACFKEFVCTNVQVDAQLQVVRKLEEKERLLQGTISTAERELTLRTQALDMNKRKVIMSEAPQTQSRLTPEG